jgi:uncharacterized membrane protein
VAVTVRLLETMVAVRTSVRREADAQALLRQAAMIWRAAEAAVTEPSDRAAIEERYRKLEKFSQGGIA